MASTSQRLVDRLWFVPSGLDGGVFETPLTPDEIAARLRRFVSAYGRRASTFEGYVVYATIDGSRIGISLSRASIGYRSTSATLSVSPRAAGSAIRLTVDPVVSRRAFALQLMVMFCNVVAFAWIWWLAGSKTVILTLLNVAFVAVLLLVAQPLVLRRIDGLQERTRVDRMQRFVVATLDAHEIDEAG